MEARIGRLIAWLKEANGFYISDQIAVKEIPSAGRGVVLAEGVIRKNDTIISIPSSHQLNFGTVLHHISKFNREIDAPEVKTSGEGDGALGEDGYEIEDPRFIAYSIFSTESLLQLTSFQLLSLYILAEWVLLPLWTDGMVCSFWKPFFDVWPTADELRSIPSTWICEPDSPFKELVPLLPASSRQHAERIASSLESDWKVIFPVVETWLEKLPNTEMSPVKLYQKFLHIYFVINSRCLYADISLKKDDNASKFTLVPYVDFLNHSDKTDIYCYPQIDKRRNCRYGVGNFQIRCGSHSYSNLGEQFLFNYGPHSNDFLLCEYGFTLGQNNWNYIDVTDKIVRMLEKDPHMTQFLQKLGYWGEYTINADDISYRTFVALSTIATGDYLRVEKLTLGYVSEDYFTGKIRLILLDLINNLLEEFQQHMKNLEGLREGKFKEDSLCVDNITRIYEGYLEILNSISIRYQK